MSKKSISQITAEVLRKKPFVNYGIEERIINISALAEKVKPEIEKELGKKLQTEAIKTAIRRYSEIRRTTVDLGDICTILKQSRLLMRNNIEMLVVPHASYQKVIEFQKGIKANDYLNVAQLTSGIVLIMDAHNMKSAEDLVGKPNIMEKRQVWQQS